MNDKLQSVELTEDHLKQLAEMITQQKQTEELQKTHKCWAFIPGEVEMNRMRKFADEKCPNCGGRLALQYEKWSMGEGTYIVCQPWGKGCGFKEDITDDDRW